MRTISRANTGRPRGLLLAGRSGCRAENENAASRALWTYGRRLCPVAFTERWQQYFLVGARDYKRAPLGISCCCPSACIDLLMR